MVEYDLCNTGTVAQIYENDLPQVAAAVNPSHQNNFLSRVGESKLAAHMSASKAA
jgi:hypothetical protein